MHKRLFAAGIVAVAIAGAGIARASVIGVTNKTLQGPYILEAGGFDENDEADTPAHSGEVGALGVVRFDGNGGFSGNLTFTTADNGGDQQSCVEHITAGTYNFTTTGAPGMGTLSLTFPASAVSGQNSAGTINFRLLVRGSDGRVARLLEDDSGPLSGLTICGEPIGTMLLRGAARKAVLDND